MRLEFRKQYFIGIFISLLIITYDIYLLIIEKSSRWFFPILILGISIGWIQFWIDFFKEIKRQKEIELKFLEFTRNLVSNVKSGVSIPKAIINTSNENYGSLSPHVKKLAKQMDWGIPIHKALVIFANDTENPVIKRSVSIIIEADESGGDIQDILESVSLSVVNIKKIKEERKSSVYSQILQGYIVFFVFIGIMLTLQLWLFPKLTESLELQGDEGTGLGSSIPGFGAFKKSEKALNIDIIFFSLTLVQGFFAGLMVGKFSEGSMKNGLLHSLILMTSAALIITTIKGGI